MKLALETLARLAAGVVIIDCSQTWTEAEREYVLRNVTIVNLFFIFFSRARGSGRGDSRGMNVDQQSAALLR